MSDALTSTAEPVHADISTAAQSGVAVVEGRQTPAMGGMGITRERWLAHAEFCRKQSVTWAQFAQGERDPKRKERFLRDSEFNWRAAEDAMRQALVEPEDFS